MAVSTIPTLFTWGLLLLILLLQGTFVASDNGGSSYLIGTGSYDITGPAADVNMMGYANIKQIASGIHFRLRARTFIVAEPNGGKRVAFVNLDACMASQIVTIKVLERLQSRYEGLYTKDNVAISGIHTHSGPGGYLQYVTYIITSLGFVRQSFDVIVDGIEKSIIQAHNNLRPGSIFVNTGELLDAGINRSPSAYLNNPAEEQAQYKYNVDKDITLLKFVDDQLGPVGSFSWYATHGTSMGRTNSLISGDNKGAAARFMEDWYFQENADHKLSSSAQLFQGFHGQPLTKVSTVASRVRSYSNNTFVAAFCQSNVGDVSPNVLGAFCIESGLPCDFNHSTCHGENELCYGRGPGYPDEFESTRIIGLRQFKKAAELFNSATEMLNGKIDYRHVYLDFSSIEVNLVSNGTERVVRTCPAAMGFAFAAGTTDGPGAFDFKQADSKGNVFWRLVRNLLKEPSEEQVECQKPKPILLDTGEMNLPYDWAPSILPLQILRIGQFIILSVPGEFTTMAGRRLRNAVKEVLVTAGQGEFGDNTHIVIAGLTNAYSQYITTFEEYQIQRYEGASTLYGPHTLTAYIQEFTKLAQMLLNGTSQDTGLSPPDLLDRQISLLPPVIVDATPIGVKFGDVKKDVAKALYKRGEMVEIVFWSACPRNDLMTEGTFALVEFLDDSDNQWRGAYDDDDFSLRFIWSRPAPKSPKSFAKIQWRIPFSAFSGTYRIRHFGAAKNLLGSIHYFAGTSNIFTVQ